MTKEHSQQKEELTEEEKRQGLRGVYKLLAELPEEEESQSGAEPPR